ncbi:MAG: hypothetical protein QW623_05560, partial [Candidatus Hadarchaeales archaeon]
MRSKIASLLILILLTFSVSAVPLVISAEEREVSGSATVTVVPYPPIVQSAVPAVTEWIPYTWQTVTVVITDQDMNLSSITLMAYESSLGSGDPDSTRNHYTWQATKSEGTWSFSCPLGSAYIDTTGCSVSE